jgi:hypothetical protein
MHRRYGVSVECDEAFLAWTSGDLERMRRAICLPTNAVDRHHLLAVYVERLFELAKEHPELLPDAVSAAKLHVDELEFLLPELVREENISTRALWLSARKRGQVGPWLTQEPPVVKACRYGIGSFARLEEGLRQLGRHAEADQVLQSPAAVLYFAGIKEEAANA